jgi:hypothetical protein
MAWASGICPQKRKTQGAPKRHFKKKISIIPTPRNLTFAEVLSDLLGGQLF